MDKKTETTTFHWFRDSENQIESPTDNGLGTGVTRWQKKLGLAREAHVITAR